MKIKKVWTRWEAGLKSVKVAHAARDRAAELQAEVRSAIRVLHGWCPRPPGQQASAVHQQQQQQQHQQVQQVQQQQQHTSSQGGRGDTVLMSPQTQMRANVSGGSSPGIVANGGNQRVGGGNSTQQTSAPPTSVVVSSTSSSMRPPPPPPPPRARPSGEGKGHHEEPTSSIPDLGKSFFIYFHIFSSHSLHPREYLYWKYTFFSYYVCTPSLVLSYLSKSSFPKCFFHFFISSLRKFHFFRKYVSIINSFIRCTNISSSMATEQNLLPSVYFLPRTPLFARQTFPFGRIKFDLVLFCCHTHRPDSEWISFLGKSHWGCTEVQNVRAKGDFLDQIIWPVPRFFFSSNSAHVFVVLSKTNENFSEIKLNYFLSRFCVVFSGTVKKNTPC